jgi:acyl-CoA synthetase (AMP-forming)/AMP-acid ligase II
MAFVLHQILSESAAKYPDKDAIVFKDDKITYAELERESNKLAYCLSGMGLERGDRVGIYINRCIDSVVGVFGILKAGATYVPIDPLCPPNRLSYILKKCGIKILITSREKLMNIGNIFPAHSPLGSILVMNGLDSGNPSLVTMKLVDWQDVRVTAEQTGSARGRLILIWRIFYLRPAQPAIPRASCCRTLTP